MEKAAVEAAALRACAGLKAMTARGAAARNLKR
jgi:hypothetical protein